MDINGLDQPEKIDAEHCTDPDFFDSSGIFGESEILPRVGDEYQAAIPDIFTPSELLKYHSSPYDTQPMTQATTSINETIEVHGDVDSSGIGIKKCATLCSSASDKKDSTVVKGDCLDQRCVTNGYSTIPGLATDAWSEFEVDSFLLGLYIFGKNFLLVERFMERKEMGQILSFYYGRFFRSDKYGRWADCRKTKGRKCIIGQRLLTGSRQQELFSRLLPHFSEESRNTSVEAYKAFADGRISVEEYVSTLKIMVGINALVEAVAIGKVNMDLTIMAMEPSRTSHVYPSRPELPSGKDYSSLTYEEIIKYLTGDFRLSKARSSNLFWEAVWPRLLEKGWHSEKPKDEAFRGSRNCLVFLLPGVKKYRRELLKGDHYFDSVSDVLKKVASEPEILMLENDENGARFSRKKKGLEGVSDHDHKCYLKPRLSSEEENNMMFTVVDTGLSIEDEPSKVRELRSLPSQTKKSSAGLRISSVAEVHVCADEVRDPEKAVIGKKRMADVFDLPQKPVKKHSDHFSSDKRARPVKHKAEQHLIHGQQECVNPSVKWRKLIDSSKAETKTMVGGFPKSLIVRQDNCALSSPVPNEKPVHRNHFHAHTCNGVSPTNSSVEDNNHCEKSNKGDLNQGSCSSAASSESHSRSLLLMIDLNLPQAPAEAEVNELVMEVKVEESNKSSQNGSNASSVSVGGSITDGICSDELANGNNARRQSTRIRPMSTRALEALESSYFDLKAAKKRFSADSCGEKSRTSRRARSKSSMHGNCTVDAVRDSETMRPNGIHNAANDVLTHAVSLKTAGP